MLLALHLRLYASTLRRTYTTSTHKTQLLELIEVPRSRFLVPAISTLRPEKLVHSDFLVFAGVPWPSFHTRLSLHSPVEYSNRRQSTQINYKSFIINEPAGSKKDVRREDDGVTTAIDVLNKEERKVHKHVAFPGDAQGFLYLYQPPPESGLPRSASSMRFRCVPLLVEASTSYVSHIAYLRSLKKKPAPRSEPPVFLPPSLTNREIYKAFKAGYDLTFPDGTPWNIPVLLINGRHTLQHLRMQLLEDNLFSASELREYENIYTNTGSSWKCRSFTLGNIFPVRFDSSIFTVSAMSPMAVKDQKKVSRAIPGGPRDKIISLEARSVFGDQRIKYGKKVPYTGAAHARLELAPGSSPSKPALCLRIVKITEPVECVIPDYDGYICMPKEGELVTRELPGKPWVWRLDPSKHTHSAIFSLVSDYAANANLH